jgi:hypothetical protein
MTLNRSLITAGLIATLPLTAGADLLVSESFDGASPGSVVSSLPGWSSFGDDAPLVAGLTHPLLPGTGAAFDDAAGSTDYRSQLMFDASDLYDDDGTFWFSFLTDVRAQNYTTDIVFGSPSQNKDGGFGIRVDDAGLEAQVAGKDTGNVSLLGGVKLILGRLTYTADGTDDILDVWVLDDTVTSLPALLPAPDATQSENIQAGDQGDYLVIYSGGGPQLTIDEFRLGTDLSDVVIPEPASMALLGLGGLLLATRRR